jgi:hypothetical protein
MRIIKQMEVWRPCLQRVPSSSAWGRALAFYDESAPIRLGETESFH